MAEERLDLRGLLCPEPVIATKRALDNAAVNAVEALVDDEICVANLERLARSQKALCSVQAEDGFFAVTISKASGQELHSHETPARLAALSAVIPEADNRKVGTVLFISKEQLGEGDADFSRTLADVFLQTLYESGHRPRAILLANSGVKLMSSASSTRTVLDDFKAAGCEVLACGLCVDYYGLKPEIATGQISNMFAICEYLLAAEKVLQF